jgi:heme o synthase
MNLSVPGAIRTHDLPLRRRLLYPTELPGHTLLYRRTLGHLSPTTQPNTTLSSELTPSQTTNPILFSMSTSGQSATPTLAAASDAAATSLQPAGLLLTASAPPPHPHMSPLVRTQAGVAMARLAHKQSKPSKFGSMMELTKPRITRLVTMTAAVGYALALPSRSWTTAELALSAATCILGTALSSSGANALNQWIERHRDARMPRTAHRPLPAGNLLPFEALAVGITTSILGVATLAIFNGLAAALVSLVTILIYVLVYTPTKPLTPLNTLIGAIPGALPPLIGWAAAMSLGTSAAVLAPTTLEAPPVAQAWYSSLLMQGGWSLFALMFVWQLPHFLAIAWMYRHDYQAGGFKMLPLYDQTGKLTALTIFVTSLLLLPATLWPAWALPNVLSKGYAAVALVTGIIYIGLCFHLARSMTTPRARLVFFASIIHLPILLLAMVAEVGINAWLSQN